MNVLFVLYTNCEGELKIFDDEGMWHATAEKLLEENLLENLPKVRSDRYDSWEEMREAMKLLKENREHYLRVVQENGVRRRFVMTKCKPGEAINLRDFKHNGGIGVKWVLLKVLEDLMQKHGPFKSSFRDFLNEMTAQFDPLTGTFKNLGDLFDYPPGEGRYYDQMERDIRAVVRKLLGEPEPEYAPESVITSGSLDKINART